jgi:hypothetical protein
MHKKGRVLLIAATALAVLCAGCCSHTPRVLPPQPATIAQPSLSTELRRTGPLLNDVTNLAHQAGEYPRLKFVVCAKPLYSEELRKSAPEGWSFAGGPSGDWLLLHDGEQVGIVQHETELEILLVAGSIGAFAVVVSYIWSRHARLLDDHRGLRPAHLPHHARGPIRGHLLSG